MAKASFFGLLSSLKPGHTSTVKTLFKQYETKLDQQKQNMSDEIREWGDALIESINNYVDRQIYIIERKYAKNIARLDEIRKQFCAEIKIHEQNENTERIEELIEKCKELKFEIPALETNLQTIPFKAIPYKKRKIPSQTDSNAVGSNSDYFDTAQMDDDEQSDDKTYGFSFDYEKSSSKRTNGPRTSYLTNGSEDYEDVGFNPSDLSPGYDEQNEDLIDKCSVCLMIFPKRMSQEKRIQHINEHDLRE